MDILSKNKMALLEKKRNLNQGKYFINLQRKIKDNNFGDYILKKFPDYVSELKEIIRQIDVNSFSFYNNNILNDLKELMNDENSLYFGVLRYQYNETISIDYRHISTFFQNLFSESNNNDDKKNYYKYIVYLSLSPQQLCLVNYLECLEIIYEKNQNAQILENYLDILDKISNKFLNHGDILEFNHIFSSYLFSHFFVYKIKNNFNLEINLLKKLTKFQIASIEFSNNNNHVSNICKSIKNFINTIKINLESYGNYYSILSYLELVLEPFKSKSNSYYNYKDQLKDIIMSTIPNIIIEMFKNNQTHNFNYLKNTYIHNFDIVISNLANTKKSSEFGRTIINILKATQQNSSEINNIEYSKTNWSQYNEVGTNILKILLRLNEKFYFEQVSNIFGINTSEIINKSVSQMNSFNNTSSLTANKMSINANKPEIVLDWGTPYNEDESKILLHIFYNSCLFFEKTLLFLNVIHPSKHPIKYQNKVFMFKNKVPVLEDKNLFEKYCRFNLRFLCKKYIENIINICIILLVVYLFLF